MRISDWSSDVCSSDLQPRMVRRVPCPNRHRPGGPSQLTPRSSHHRRSDLQANEYCVHAFDAGNRLSRRIDRQNGRSEEHTSELQSLMRISYSVFCLHKKHIITVIITSFNLYYINI